MKKLYMLLLAALILMAGCSDDDTEAKKAHVWKEQTDTMNKARAVEETLQKSADAERKQIEEQTR